MMTRSRRILGGACLSVAVALVPACHKSHYTAEPTVRDGRLEELMALPPGYDTQTAGYSDEAQELTDRNAELRARYEDELGKALQSIEQSKRSDQDGPMHWEPLREEPVRSIWDTKPEYAP